MIGNIKLRLLPHPVPHAESNLRFVADRPRPSTTGWKFLLGELWFGFIDARIAERSGVWSTGRTDDAADLSSPPSVSSRMKDYLQAGRHSSVEVPAGKVSARFQLYRAMTKLFKPIAAVNDEETVRKYIPGRSTRSAQYLRDKRSTGRPRVVKSPSAMLDRLPTARRVESGNVCDFRQPLARFAVVARAGSINIPRHVSWPGRPACPTRSTTVSMLQAAKRLKRSTHPATNRRWNKRWRDSMVPIVVIGLARSWYATGTPADVSHATRRKT